MIFYQSLFVLVFCELRLKLLIKFIRKVILFSFLYYFGSIWTVSFHVDQVVDILWFF